MRKKPDDVIENIQFSAFHQIRHCLEWENSSIPFKQPQNKITLSKVIDLQWNAFTIHTQFRLPAIDDVEHWNVVFLSKEEKI